MRRLLNQAANAAARTKGSIFEKHALAGKVSHLVFRLYGTALLNACHRQGDSDRRSRTRGRGLLSVHLRYGLHARQVAFATLCTRGFSSLVASDCYRVERTSSRAGLLPPWTTAFHGAPGNSRANQVLGWRCTPRRHQTEDSWLLRRFSQSGHRQSTPIFNGSNA
jgi:hypothetical protein